MEQVPIAVRIEKEGKQVAQSIVTASMDSSFNAIVARVIGGLEKCHEKVDTIFTGSQSMDVRDLFEVGPDTLLRDAVTAIGICTKILCRLKPTIVPPKERTNVFQQMMANAASVVYPEKKDRKDGRDEIYNCVVEYLKKRNAGFNRFQKNEMQEFMSLVVSALWYLDGQTDKISSAPGVHQIPSSLRFIPQNGDTFRTLYHGSERKKTIPSMSRTEMIGFFERLEALCATAYIRSKSWSEVLADMMGLRDTFAGYIQYLNAALDREQQQDCSETELPGNRSLKTVSANTSRSSLAKVTYKGLEQLLVKEHPFTPVNVILFAPLERKARYKYIQGLSFEFEIHVYRSFKPNGTFVWKLPSKYAEIDLSNTIRRLEGDLDLRIKTDKTKRAVEIFGGLASWTEKSLKEFSAICSGDDDTENGVPTNVVEEIETLLDEGHDVGDVIEIHEQEAESRKDKFNNFWHAVEEVVSENDLAVAPERRHGTTNWISPLCVSMRDLMDKSTDKMHTLFPDSPSNNVPSIEYFRLQFTPRNPHTNTAKRYYSKFDIKYGLQVRTLRKTHPDQHYGAKQFQYMKIMAGRFHDTSLVFFVDDKAAIPVGFEGAPVSATRRQRTVLKTGLDDRGLNALDHDNIPQHLTPSVSIKLVPPEELSNAWYAGQPCIIIKDAIFEHSTAFRHASELINRYSEAERLDRPMLFIGSDGGPDHNVTSIMVMLSYIATFLYLDLDFLCAVRTPPHFSFINPAERFMSTANIALIGVSLARNHLGEKEKLVKNLLSKKQWRDAQDKNPQNNYPNLALESTKDARELLQARFKSLLYKGERVQVGAASTDEQINAVKSKITALFPSIDLNKTSKNQALSDPLFKKFFEDHVKATAYAFQIKKCGDEKCLYHDVRRLNQHLEVGWLPTPKLKGEKYKTFEEVYGTDPDNEDQPSRTINKKDDGLPRPPFSLAASRARIIVTCTECNFPRVLYSRFSMSEKELFSAQCFIEDNYFVCGVQLDGLPGVFQNPKVQCSDPIHLHYYQSSSLPGYKNLCSKCCSRNANFTHNKVNLCSKCYSMKHTKSAPKQ